MELAFQVRRVTSTIKQVSLVLFYEGLSCRWLVGGRELGEVDQLVELREKERDRVRNLTKVTWRDAQS